MIPEFIRTSADHIYHEWAYRGYDGRDLKRATQCDPETISEASGTGRGKTGI